MKYGVAMRTPGGKGDIQRPSNRKNFNEGYDRIFGKKPKKYLNDILEEQEEKELAQEYNDERLNGD
jgi:hypothetical protein